MPQLIIRGLLGLFIMVPLVLGMIRYKIANQEDRMFLGFIIIGFLVDVVMWVLTYLEITNHLLLIFNLYSLVEAFFFFWFLWITASSNSIRSISKAALFATVPLWVLFIFVVPTITREISGGATFATVYYILVSFLAGFALLELVEKGMGVFSNPLFWFTLGIFLCSFCTFYTMTFIGTKISQQIWFLNNIFNIASYLLYSMGFWKISGKPNLA